MIERTQSYKVGEKVFATLSEAQGQALMDELGSANFATDAECQKAIQVILDHANAVVDILTTTSTSKPKARKIHGGTKTRKQVQPEQKTP